MVSQAGNKRSASPISSPTISHKKAHVAAAADDSVRLNTPPVDANVASSESAGEFREQLAASQLVKGSGPPHITLSMTPLPSIRIQGSPRHSHHGSSSPIRSAEPATDDASGDSKTDMSLDLEDILESGNLDVARKLLDNGADPLVKQFDNYHLDCPHSYLFTRLIDAGEEYGPGNHYWEAAKLVAEYGGVTGMGFEDYKNYAGQVFLHGTSDTYIAMDDSCPNEWQRSITFGLNTLQGILEESGEWEDIDWNRRCKEARIEGRATDTGMWVLVEPSDYKYDLESVDWNTMD